MRTLDIAGPQVRKDLYFTRAEKAGAPVGSTHKANLKIEDLISGRVCFLAAIALNATCINFASINAELECETVISTASMRPIWFQF